MAGTGEATEICFLGTGSYLASGRYWNSFVLDGSVLVEPCPTALPHLRRCGLRAADLDVVVMSHFHADHTFGWPFLLLELVQQHTSAPLHVVGPRGVRAHLAEMLGVAGVPNVLEAAERTLDLCYVEVDGSWQQAGPLRFRAVEVDHVPHLECYGYVFERDGLTVGYSGDTRPCVGLDEIAANVDLLVVECNGRHPPSPLPVTHMDIQDVRDLRARHRSLPFMLTHLGEEPDLAGLPDVHVPGDFEMVRVPPRSQSAGEWLDARRRNRSLGSAE